MVRLGLVKDNGTLRSLMPLTLVPDGRVVPFAVEGCDFLRHSLYHAVQWYDWLVTRFDKDCFPFKVIESNAFRHQA